MLTPAEIQNLIVAETEARRANKPVTPRRDFLIQEPNLPDLCKRLDGLVRRTAKLNVSGLKYEVGEFADIPTRVSYPDPISDSGISYRTVLRRCFALHIDGESPKLGGWSFAGTVQHLKQDDGTTVNIVRSILEIPAPLQYRTSDPYCEHCNTSRRRADTFLVYHSERGEWKQIGRNCTADFLGHADAERLALFAEHLSEALGACGTDEEGGFGGGRGQNERWPILDVLAQTKACIEAFGWLSRSKAKEEENEGKTATADIVVINLDPFLATRKGNEHFIVKEVTSQHVALAEAAVEWARNLPEVDVEKSDYLSNIRTIAKIGAVDAKLAGYACSIVPGYCREQDKLREREAEAKLGTVSEHVGSVGERLILTVTVIKIQHIESDFGVSSLYVMADSKGNRFKWFCSGEGLYDGARKIEPGETCTIKGTVKKLEVYKSIKMTALSRCSVHVEKAPKEKKARAKKSKPTDEAGQTVGA